MIEEEIYFEMLEAENFVRLEPIELIQYDSVLDWDRSWISTTVKINGGKFSGRYVAEFMTVDFEKFKQEVSKLYDNLAGTAYFTDLEGYLELKVLGDGIGHFTVAVSACDRPGADGSELTFSFGFDQTQI